MNQRVWIESHRVIVVNMTDVPQSSQWREVRKTIRFSFHRLPKMWRGILEVKSILSFWLCLHSTGSSTYRILFHIGLGLCLCGSTRIRYALPQQSGTASAGGTKMDPQSVPLCFTCKHRNLIWNAPKLRSYNRMASMQMKLIDWSANRQRKQQIW